MAKEKAEDIIQQAMKFPIVNVNRKKSCIKN